MQKQSTGIKHHIIVLDGEGITEGNLHRYVLFGSLQKINDQILYRLSPPISGYVRFSQVFYNLFGQLRKAVLAGIPPNKVLFLGYHLNYDLQQWIAGLSENVRQEFLSKGQVKILCGNYNVQLRAHSHKRIQMQYHRISAKERSKIINHKQRDLELQTPTANTSSSVWESVYVKSLKDINGRRRRSPKWKRRIADALTLAFQVRDRGCITIYDGASFFANKSFLEAQKLLGLKGSDVVYEGKRIRSKFSMKDLSKIRQYNKQELLEMHELYTHIVELVEQSGWKLKDWHGAGALAEAMLRKAKITSIRKVRVHEPIFEKVISAYYGGRIEQKYIGQFNEVYEYDIRSAYPSALSDLPLIYPDQFSHIEHPSTLASLSEATIVHVKWLIKDRRGLLLPPFPYRHKGHIYYCLEGEGWYWKKEVEQALKLYPEDISLLEAIEFKTSEEKPFKFIKELYAQREELAHKGQEGIALLIKAGLNSIYGKLAQKVGSRQFYHPYYAGLVTSHVRTRMFEAAAQNPKAIISFETDGIYAMRELDIEVREGLGNWKMEKHQDVLFLQNGFFMSRGKVRHRGLMIDEFDTQTILSLWRRMKLLITIPIFSRRLVSWRLARALKLNPGQWYTYKGIIRPLTSKYDIPRTLALYKRYPDKSYWPLVSYSKVADIQERYKSKVNSFILDQTDPYLLDLKSEMEV